MENKILLIIIFGLVSSALTSIRLVPQVLKSYYSKHTKDLSFIFVSILFFQAFSLIIYGSLKNDPYIVWMNVLPLICSCLLVILKLKYK